MRNCAGTRGRSCCGWRKCLEFQMWIEIGWIAFFVTIRITPLSAVNPDRRITQSNYLTIECFWCNFINIYRYIFFLMCTGILLRKASTYWYSNPSKVFNWRSRSGGLTLYLLSCTISTLRCTNMGNGTSPPCDWIERYFFLIFTSFVIVDRNQKYFYW